MGGPVTSDARVRRPSVLVLSRQKHECLRIGDSVEIEVFDVRGDKVRLAVRAPKDVSVHRREIYDALQREKGPANTEVTTGTGAKYLHRYVGRPSPQGQGIVLSRQVDESIMIGDEVEVTVVDVRGDTVRLGITFPKDIPIHRREIYDAIQREKASHREQEPQRIEAGKLMASTFRENVSIDLYIDPGHASAETIQEVLTALSDLHAAAGGLGLEFKSDGHFVHAAEGVAR